MPMYDYKCPYCDHTKLDVLEPIDSLNTQWCSECKTEFMERVWLGKAAGVIGDDIPGGVWINHLESTPRKFYSKSEIAKAAKAKGLRNHVEHITPLGTDKAPHTTRWV